MADKTPTNEARGIRQVLPQDARARNLSEGERQASPSHVIEEPGLASTEEILTLQRLAGNQAVTRLIQTKLVVGAADDPYEREADRVADQVLAMPTAAVPQQQNAVPARSMPGAQREVSPEEEEIQTKPLAAGITPLQRAAEEEEEVQTLRLQRLEDEEEIQARPIQRLEDEEEVQTLRLQRQEDEEEIQTRTIQRAAEEEEEVQTARGIDPRGSFTAGTGVETALRSQQGSGSPLPGELRAFMEPRFGADFSGVRLHTGGEAAALNQALHAQAFTHGQDIYLGAGHYDPGSPSGKHLLAHELTHVVQQTGGRLARKTRSIEDIPIHRSVIQRVLGAWGKGPPTVKPDTPKDIADRARAAAEEKRKKQAAELESNITGIVTWVEEVIADPGQEVVDGSHKRVNYFPHRTYKASLLDAAMDRWQAKGGGYHGYKVAVKDGIRQAHFLKPHPNRERYNANVHVKPSD